MLTLDRVAFSANMVWTEGIRQTTINRLGLSSGPIALEAPPFENADDHDQRRKAHGQATLVRVGQALPHADHGCPPAISSRNARAA